MEIISARATTNPSSVFAEYITAGPTIWRTAFKSFVARDIRSPVRCAWKYDDRHLLELREEVVAHVVLDVARRPDQDPAHQEAEEAADHPDARAAPAIQGQLPARDPGREVVDGELQHPGRGERDAGGSDDAGKPQEEVATIGPDVSDQTPER